MRTATILRTKASTGKCSAATTAKRGMVGSSATGSSRGWAGRRGAPLRSDFVARGVAVGKDGFPLEEDFPRKRRQVAPLLYVRQVMTQASDVTCLSSDGSLRDALELFLEKRVSGAPVIDGKGKLVGVLSMTDIIWVETTEAMDALPFQSEQADTGVGVDVDLMLKVSTRMSRNVVSIKPGDLLDKAAALMIERSINRLPVVNPAGEVVGIITRLDIMRCLAAVWL